MQFRAVNGVQSRFGDYTRNERYQRISTIKTARCFKGRTRMGRFDITSVETKTSKRSLHQTCMVMGGPAQILVESVCLAMP